MTITDQSANSNNFAVTAGTLMKSEDCPSNIFCTNNGNQDADDGPFVYTGMRPQMVIICRENSDDEIEIYDYKRAGLNGKNAHLNANLTTAEDATGNRVHMYSNGFKVLTGSSGPTNANDAPYYTMAWGQSLVGSNGVPCTAR